MFEKPIKPIDSIKRIRIQVTDPMITTPFPFSSSQSPVIRGYRDGKRCSREQVNDYVKNWERILPPRIVRSIKKHHDVLHGARSVNMIVGPKYSRTTKDFDIYSKQPCDRAEEIENEIDKACGCDMAYVHRQPIPKMNMFTPEDPYSAKEVYIIKTVPSQNGEVDYMLLPRGLPTHTKDGIRHEDLREAYRKAKRNIMHPMRSAKATKDIRRIEAYWRSRGKKV